MRALKENVTTNQNVIKLKLAAIQPEVEKMNQLQGNIKNLKSQIKPIAEQKRSNTAKVKQLKQSLNEKIEQVKQSKKRGNRELAEAQLLEAFQLADQITIYKKKILAQEKLIGDLLNR